MEVPRGFTRCDECGGKGWRWNLCPSCSGSGLRPTEKLREEALQTICHYRVRDPDASVPTVVDAVLRKVAEHIREER